MNLLKMILLLLPGTTCYAQDYIAYQRVFNRVDEDVLAGDHDKALLRLDSVYKEYDFIYAKHCVKALQLCCMTNDSIRAVKWLAKSFRQGVPVHLIRGNGLAAISLNYINSSGTLQLYDSLHTAYESSINTGLRRKIDSLMTIDQDRTRKVNDGFFLFRYTIYGLQWINNNRKQFEIINNITDHYGFPGERLIGLPAWVDDSLQSSRERFVYGSDFDEYRAYIMLIHYYSRPKDDINEKLYRNVVNGCMPASQYGALNDFMAEWGKKKYDSSYYNVWHKDTNVQHLHDISRRRHAIGLNSQEQQERNRMIYLERRKNKILNKEVILE